MRNTKYIKQLTSKPTVNRERYVKHGDRLQGRNRHTVEMYTCRN